ncbi:hypothetical protein EBR21_09430 [bacterium]|nr:hypothetical protein [bacterium]
MKFTLSLGILLVCSLATGCHVQNQNLGAKQVFEPDSVMPSNKSALMVANVLSKETSKSAYCVLQVKGVSGPDLLDKKFAGVRDVVAVHGSSISMDHVTELKTPELRSLFGLDASVSEASSSKELQADLERVSQSSGSSGHSCEKAALNAKGELGIAEPNLGFGWFDGVYACVWACQLWMPGAGKIDVPSYPKAPIIRVYPSKSAAGGSRLPPI